MFLSYKRKRFSPSFGRRARDVESHIGKDMSPPFRKLMGYKM